MNFGSCQNEYDMFGRFFKRFEQGIERLGCEHMNLVNDVNPVFALCGLELNLVNNLTDIINFSVGCGLHFDNGEDTAVGNSLAEFTFTAGISVYGMKAIDCLRKNFCTGSFARTS